MLLPPPLAWIDSYCKSLSVALGQIITYSCTPTINPLVHQIKLKFEPTLSNKNKLLAWNIYQIFATLNDSVPKGEMLENSNIWVLDVIVKRRLGPIRNEHPLGEMNHDNNRRIR